MNTETFTVRAEELKGTARDDVWPKLLAESPSLREFDATTTRRIALFLLARAKVRSLVTAASVCRPADPIPPGDETFAPARRRHNQPNASAWRSASVRLLVRVFWIADDR